MSVLIPSSLLRSTISVEPFQGASAYGPVYGAAVDVKARFEGKRRLVRRPGGEDIIASATVFVRPDAAIPHQSRVTFNGRVYEVVDVLDGEGLTGPAFLEVLLS